MLVRFHLPDPRSSLARTRARESWPPACKMELENLSEVKRIILHWSVSIGAGVDTHTHTWKNMGTEELFSLAPAPIRRRRYHFFGQAIRVDFGPTAWISWGTRGSPSRTRRVRFNPRAFDLRSILVNWALGCPKWLVKNGSYHAEMGSP